MGLKEQINAGSVNLKRDTVIITTSGASPQYSGSVELGATSVLVSIQASSPGRIRLYGDSASRADVTEKARPFASQSLVGDTIALVSDVMLDTGDTLRFYPPVYAASFDTASVNRVYYTIDTGSANPWSGTNTVKINRFLLEDSVVSILPEILTRETLIVSASSLSAGQTVYGSFTTPRTYLILQAKAEGTVPLRFRLYSYYSSSVDVNEISRPFTTEPVSGSGVIADFYMDTVNQLFPLSPVVLGRNDDDIILSDAAPEQKTYYALTNASGVSASVSASLKIFSLED